MGLIEKADVIRWADAVIQSEASPAAWVLDVSLSANESNDAIAARLKDVVDGIDVTAPAHNALERFAQTFRSGQLAPLDAAQKLVLWANIARVPYETRAEAFEVKFIAEDVADGLYGSSDDVTAAIERFLARHETTRRAG